MSEKRNFDVVRAAQLELERLLMDNPLPSAPRPKRRARQERYRDISAREYMYYGLYRTGWRKYINFETISFAGSILAVAGLVSFLLVPKEFIDKVLSPFTSKGDNTSTCYTVHEVNRSISNLTENSNIKICGVAATLSPISTIYDMGTSDAPAQEITLIDTINSRDTMPGALLDNKADTRYIVTRINVTGEVTGHIQERYNSDGTSTRFFSILPDQSETNLGYYNQYARIPTISRRVV